MAHKLHLDLVYPLQNGVITNLEAARDFLNHVRSRIGTSEDTELRVVIGLPSKAGEKAREDLRLAATRIFDRVILIPEPFLAALGSRESNANSDAVANSLFVDIGAGSTDMCLIQGCYPSDDDQLSIEFAGDQVDEIVQDTILSRYPDCGITLPRCRDIKERNSFVCGSKETIMTPVMIRGNLKSLEVGEAIDRGCTELLQRVFQGVEYLIERADPDSIPGLLQNIFLTGDIFSRKPASANVASSKQVTATSASSPWGPRSQPSRPKNDNGRIFYVSVVTGDIDLGVGLLVQALCGAGIGWRAPV